ncbi:PREDICTED: A disintegrin and metalloproteinase with thrombospondin motifs 20-like [Corvus brachyrhynchos]|uniref:A disintegrin and metalloproteinase with thrombospondin motifs 20-like n=1 Tax=Corvus brachyrhynchos TaxID=85066 RepID=UPI000816505A|nr:PREDICTED: A disintegrin and metalloproteinase with thrombospondin motifs 20-like [Corvus brachyrhynchos]
MHLENPKEYLTLVKGEADNFSEVYGFRLQNPYECPFNGSRRQDCACQNDYLAAGFTVFSKIRFDVSSMQIKTTDFLFAQTIFGRAVPFATAGDCYSAARCPQGQFSINLAGTGLRLSSTVKWIAQGNYATADIHKSHVSQCCFPLPAPTAWTRSTSVDCSESYSDFCESKTAFKVSDPFKSYSAMFNHTVQYLIQTRTACLPFS